MTGPMRAAVSPRPRARARQDTTPPQLKGRFEKRNGVVRVESFWPDRCRARIVGVPSLQLRAAMGSSAGLLFLSALFVLYYCVIKVIYRKYRAGLAFGWCGRAWGSRERQAGLGARGAGDSERLAVLLLIAHPDDECMFFCPTLLTLLRLHCCVSVLCLSSGNYYGQGEVRKKELLASCGTLGVPETQVTVIDHRDLPDSPAVQWDMQLLSTLVLKHIQDNHIQLVVTFDQGGVSSHANHIALYKSVRSLREACSGVREEGCLALTAVRDCRLEASQLLVELLFRSGKIREGCRILMLETVNIFRKYISILDLPISWFRSHDGIHVLTSQEYKRAKNAMWCHRSQLLWFRHLYLFFSRYMFVNTFHLLSREEQS
nr:PREDICTED: N-acetylglucosaminyl-phosphatidylinositol de-N-acetylase [Latimeria chalumnae]|eukprot:XP_014349838.1 PREDICTED: N-acetylglucosaminyl-phosphatidylinositol de-N-acetylase [Latimeria chalumnae]